MFIYFTSKSPNHISWRYQEHVCTRSALYHTWKVNLLCLGASLYLIEKNPTNKETVEMRERETERQTNRQTDRQRMGHTAAI